MPPVRPGQGPKWDSNQVGPRPGMEGTQMGRMGPEQETMGSGTHQHQRRALPLAEVARGNERSL